MPSNRAENHATKHLPVLTGNGVVSVGCDLDAHDGCDQHHCQIARVAALCEELSDAQIKVAVATAITGLVCSALFDLALIAVWYHHAIDGRAMPEVPWFIISIATATHAAGGLSALKIPRKPKVLTDG